MKRVYCDDVHLKSRTGETEAGVNLANIKWQLWKEPKRNHSTVGFKGALSLHLFPPQLSSYPQTLKTDPVGWPKRKTLSGYILVYLRETVRSDHVIFIMHKNKYCCELILLPCFVSRQMMWCQASCTAGIHYFCLFWCVLWDLSFSDFLNAHHCLILKITFLT